MCGIAGFFARAPVAPQTVERMMDELRRRGPDAQVWTGWDDRWQREGDANPAAPYNALLHARLSIIDPRPEANQPMPNDTGDVWLCYNGEIYDWAGHAAELRAQGVAFRTRSDSELILRAYERWGIDCVERLRGMFAFAIVDLRRKVVWIVRDRMGLKPLIYAKIGEDLVFGSTVRAVLPFLPKDARGFRADAIDAYLAHRYVPAPMTILDGVERLENAHLLRFDLETRALEKRCYWKPDAGDAPADWKATLEAAIEMRTVADRPLGVFLSSGIDSSVIAARLAAAGHTDLHTFTAGFPGSHMDESPQAAEIARALGLPNHVVAIPSGIAADFDRIVADLDEPFADPSSVPTWYLSREATQHVKVVLGGDGGDELLAGYKRVPKHLRTGWRRGITLPSLALKPDLDPRGWGKLAAELRLDWATAYGLRFSGFTPPQRLALQPARKLERAVYWRMPEGERSPLHTLLEIDRLNYLPEYILRKADLCTMAHGLELRAPLLDHRFFLALSRVPDAQRFTRPPKKILAAAMPQLEPLHLFQRKKRGFNPPLTAWLGDDLRDRVDGLGQRLERHTGAQIDARAVEELVRRYRAGRASFAEQLLQLVLLDVCLQQLAAAMRA